MYTLSGLYLLAPILSRWTAAASQREMEFYLTLWCISLCFPLFRLFASCDTSTAGVLYYFTGYAGYFILGFYLRRYPERLTLRIVIPAMDVTVAAPVVCKLFTLNVSFYDMFWYLSIFVAIQCVFWHQIVSHITKKCKWTHGLLTLVSNLSFGIYLVHIFIMRNLLWHFEPILSIKPYALQTVTVATLTLVLSFIVCYALSFMPFAKYIIGFSANKK